MGVKIYRCTLEVRGYELDSFGHVNHAVYVSYLEQARWKMLEEEKITLEDFESWKSWPVIARLELSYLKPAFMGELLDIETTPLRKGGASLLYEQKISRAGTPILSAKVTAVMIDENGKLARLHPRMAEMAESEKPA